jgi:predicted  nucleic acid-binding Zn-ribbon protein
VNREEREAEEVRARKAAEEAKRVKREHALAASGGTDALERKLAELQVAQRALREEIRLATAEHRRRAHDLAQEEQRTRSDLAFFESRRSARAWAADEQALLESRSTSWTIQTPR